VCFESSRVREGCGGLTISGVLHQQKEGKKKKRQRGQEEVRRGGSAACGSEFGCASVALNARSVLWSAGGDNVVVVVVGGGVAGDDVGDWEYPFDRHQSVMTFIDGGVTVGNCAFT
jgi:hypothetical protein